MSGVGSHPVEAPVAGEFLTGKQLTPEVIAAAAELAAKPAKPLDNADLNHFWRKRMVRVLVEQALERVTGGAKRDTGRHAAEAALAALAVKEQLAEPRRSAGFS